MTQRFVLRGALRGAAGDVFAELAAAVSARAKAAFFAHEASFGAFVRSIGALGGVPEAAPVGG